MYFQNTLGLNSTSSNVALVVGSGQSLASLGVKIGQNLTITVGSSSYNAVVVSTVIAKGLTSNEKSVVFAMQTTDADFVLSAGKGTVAGMTLMFGYVGTEHAGYDAFTYGINPDDIYNAGYYYDSYYVI